MSATEFLDNCYSALSSATKNLYFSPYTTAYGIFSSSRSRQTYGNLQRSYGGDPSLSFALQVGAVADGQHYAAGAVLLLTPILLPLTVATFVLAAAIDIAAFLTKLITYPIASCMDTAPSNAF